MSRQVADKQPVYGGGIVMSAGPPVLWRRRRWQAGPIVGWPNARPAPLCFHQRILQSMQVTAQLTAWRHS